MTNRLESAFELKAVDAEGVFEGYASIFDRVDDGRDAVLPGAFARSLADKGARAIKLLWQHDPKEPIGFIESLVEDMRGLYVRARLLPEVQRAREALSLMRAGALDGLSIGYRALKARHEPGSGVRLLEDIDLQEISLVTFPMQRAARIAAFKAAAPHSLRDFETFLRDAGGFSRREAKALAASGFRAIGAGAPHPTGAARRDAGADWTPALDAALQLISEIEETDHDA